MSTDGSEHSLVIHLKVMTAVQERVCLELMTDESQRVLSLLCFESS